MPLVVLLGMTPCRKPPPTWGLTFEFLNQRSNLGARLLGVVASTKRKSNHGSRPMLRS